MNEVNLLNFYSLAALIHLARHLVAYNVIHASLKSKRNSFITFVAVVGVGMLWSFLTVEYLNTVNETLLYLIFVALEAGVVFLTCEGTTFAKIFTVGLVAIANLITSVIAVPFMVAVGIPYSYFVSTTMPAFFIIIYAVLSFSISFLYAFVIKLVKSKISSKGRITTTKSYFFLAVPLVNIIYFLSYASISQSMGSEAMNGPAYSKLRNTTYIVAAISLVTSVGILLLVDYIDKIERKNIENEKQILANTMTYQQTIMLSEEKKELRKVRHDLKNLLATATGFIEIGKTDKALEILNETGHSVFGAAKNSTCTNEIIGTIIYIKRQKAAEQNVELNVNVEEEAIVKIADYDLCRLLHNLIDNSINAAENADKKSEISINIEKENISIITQNGFCADKKQKKSDGNHGYGLTIIKEICKKYSGDYTVRVEGNTYRTFTKVANVRVD